MDISPETRAETIKIIADRLLEVTTGHTRQEAEEVATAMVDKAAADGEDGSNAS
jgi:hypothetical protein